MSIISIIISNKLVPVVTLLSFIREVTVRIQAGISIILIEVFRAITQTLQPNAREYLQTAHDRLLPHLVTIYHSTLFSLSYWQRRQIKHKPKYSVRIAVCGTARVLTTRS
jgi:hypothetical protein